MGRRAMAKKTDGPREGDLRVWHIPQVPCPPFLVSVPDVAQAKLVLRALADYDRFQFENRVKPDYCNAQGLEVFECAEWCEWSNTAGDDIGDVMRGEAA